MERSSTLNNNASGAVAKEGQVVVHPVLAQFAAQMGVDILGGNQVASKIPSDFFQKQS